MIRLKAVYYDDIKIQNNGPKDRFVLYLEKKEKQKIEEKILDTIKKLNFKYKNLNKNIK